MTFAFQYKCRRCSKVYTSAVIYGEAKAFELTMNALTDSNTEVFAPDMLTLHTCGPHECGIADFIGYEPEK